MFFNPVVVFAYTVNNVHFLFIVVTHRDHHFPAHFQLVFQGKRNSGSTGSNNDPVERCQGRQAFVAISKKAGRRIPDGRQKLMHLVVQLFLPFDGKHFGTHGTQNCCLVARTSAYFQNLLVFLNLQKLRLKSHGVGLRNGLPGTNRESLVFICKIDKPELSIKRWRLVLLPMASKTPSIFVFL